MMDSKELNMSQWESIQDRLKTTDSDDSHKTNRLVFLSQVIHESAWFSDKDQPVDVRGNFECNLYSKKETYRPKMFVGDLIELDLGPIKSPALVLIKNITEWEGPLIPTPGQEQDIAKRCVELGPPELPDWMTIKPGMCVPLIFPQTPIMVRSVHKEAKITIFAVDR